ncbi:hypothetical protein SSX86_007747 [Deinandra increscens subsp. villosa]|uniref:Uncharacterized protein n=1 Tax=Deinandra increscens subsp. villosa TaxID=3103831 RepID=A0AAP0H3D3_9ASTR
MDFPATSRLPSAVSYASSTPYQSSMDSPVTTSMDYPPTSRHLHTTRSLQFLGLKTSDSSVGLLKDSDFGSDLVTGVLDTLVYVLRDRASTTRT